MPRREKLNEEYLDRRIRETRGDTRKVTWPGRRGAPDRLCGWSHLRRAVFVEVKEEDQPWGLQDHQAREHTRLRSWGFDVRVVHNKEEIDALIRELTGQ